MCVSYAAGRERLRARFTDLVLTLDGRIICAYMYEQNALTLKDLQSVQSVRDQTTKATEILLNIIMEQSDAVYQCFLDALKDTEQQHIYEMLVVKEGVLCHFISI